jgi:diguanylate cyclase (GGDEF)-like protein
MAQHQIVPILVLSKHEEDLELVNRLMRRGGHAVRCTRVPDLSELADAVRSQEPELLWLFGGEFVARIEKAAAIRADISPILPIIAVSGYADEAKITSAIKAGAHDLVSTDHPDRMLAIAERELRAYRLEHALRNTLISANRYRRELKAVMTGAAEAIAYTKEGILVDANPAWAELFGYADPDSMQGLPLMDYFDAGSQTTLKGALIACARKQWTSDLLRVEAIDRGGSTIAIELRLEEAEFDDEIAVRLCVPRDQAGNPEPEQLVEIAVHKDPMTGCYHRRHFIELLSQRLQKSPAGGVRALAYLRPDKFGDVKNEVGPLASEDILIELADVLRGLIQPSDICGRFGGVVFTILVERGTLRDVEAWAENTVRVISDHIFEINGKTISMTCSLGLSEVTAGTNRVESLVLDAERANARGRQRGGDQVVLAEISDESTRIRRFDDLWVQRIKTALMENRFRLIHLPVASLHGKAQKIYDTVVRLVDEQGDEVSATEFIQAAERNQLLKALDRWVIAASFAFCQAKTPDMVLVKLSKDSITDSTLADWLGRQIAALGLQAERVCFQVDEELATQYLKPLKALMTQLKRLGFSFAIEHFGVGRKSVQLLEQLPVRAVKIDGSLMQNIASNPAQQERVKALVDAAESREIETIAERVEQASTMAVLFQLGVDYMQGHYLHEPEVVLEEP